MLQYLLGALPQQWQARFEEKLFTEQQCLERLRVVEDKLVDDYVSDTLSAADRERFEKYYLVSDRRRRKVELAQALKQSLADLTPAATPQPSPTPSTAWQQWREQWAARKAQTQTRWRIAIFVGGVFLLGGGLCLLALLFRTARPAPDQRQARIEPTVLTPVPSITPAATTPTPAPTASGKPTLSPSALTASLTIELEPGDVRDGAHTQRRIARGRHSLSTIRLKLLLRQPTKNAVWRVSVSSDGKEILQTSGTRTQQSFVEATLPAHKLPAGDYIISLQGKTAAGNFAEVEAYTLHLTDQ